MIKKLIFLFYLLLKGTKLFAQDKEAEMADVLRSNGKIYTVVAVVLVIFAGLIVYLFLTERKLRNIERKLNK